MERPEKAPQRHDELRDPKLPVIHGSTCRAEQRVCPAPIPQPRAE